MKSKRSASKSPGPAAPVETSESADKAVAERIVPIGIRMTRAQHRNLQRIVFEANLLEPAEKVTLNSLLVEGVERVIEDRKRKGVPGLV